MQHASRRLAALLLSGGGGLLLAGFPPAKAQDPKPPADARYTFKSTYAVGDVRVVDRSLEDTFDATYEAQGQQFSTSLANRGRQTYREEVLAVKDGRPVAVKRTYTTARFTANSKDGKPVTTVYSHQGKTVTLRQTGTKVVVTAEKGKLAPADLQMLQADFRTTGRSFPYPEKPLAPGEPWPVDRALMQMVMPSKRVAGEVKGIFERLEERSGHTLGRIRFDVEVTGWPGNAPYPFTAVGDVVGYYDLSINRELGMVMSLPMSAEGDFEVEGQKVHVFGSGLVRIKHAIKWVKVAGKPPVPSASKVETASG